MSLPDIAPCPLISTSASPPPPCESSPPSSSKVHKPQQHELMKCTMQAPPQDALHALQALLTPGPAESGISPAYLCTAGTPPRPSPTNHCCVLPSALIRLRACHRARVPVERYSSMVPWSPSLSSRSLTGSKCGRLGPVVPVKQLRTVTPAGQARPGRCWSSGGGSLECSLELPGLQVGRLQDGHGWMLAAGSCVTPMQISIMRRQARLLRAIKLSPSLAHSCSVRPRPHRFLFSSSFPYPSWFCPLSC